MPKRILVTGASGFVGRHLMPLLRTEYPNATLIASSHTNTMVESDEIVSLDLADGEQMGAVLRDIQPDVVIHLAAQAAVKNSFDDPDLYWRVNVEGPRKLAAAMHAQRSTALVLFASSAEVYGLTFQRNAPLDEQAAMAPSNPYAVSKAAADLALGEMALRGLRVIRLRLFNQVGAGQSEDFAVPAFARQIALAEAGGQPAQLRVGALDRWRDFVDVRDGCTAFIAALRHAEKLPVGVAINIASGIPRRVGDVLDALLDRAQIRLEISVDKASLRLTDVERVSGDASLARRLLGWTPVRDWNETLDMVMADWRERVAR